MAVGTVRYTARRLAPVAAAVVTMVGSQLVGGPSAYVDSATGWVQFDAGGYHTCGIRANHALWCWGFGGDGGLGNGTRRQHSTPFPVGRWVDWMTVSAGDRHTCGTRMDGTLWCWGYNITGQVGDGTTQDRLSPVQVGSASDWGSVSAGRSHTCATRTDGTLWCWGSDSYGALGTGGSGDSATPVRVAGDSTWTAISAGGWSSCAVRSDHSLWCWGWNGHGQLGTGGRGDRSRPTQVGSLTTWDSASASMYAHTCATRLDATLWCWGANAHGEIGDGTVRQRLEPVEVGAATEWSEVDAGGYAHSCPVATNGDVWCWGDNRKGQLGLGTKGGEEHLPQQVGGSGVWSDVSLGRLFSSAGRTHGSLWTWGANGQGQLGDGSRHGRTSPVQVAFG